MLRVEVQRALVFCVDSSLSLSLSVTLQAPNVSQKLQKNEEASPDQRAFLFLGAETTIATRALIMYGIKPAQHPPTGRQGGYMHRSRLIRPHSF
jgi:hypothetical protein